MRADTAAYQKRDVVELSMPAILASAARRGDTIRVVGSVASRIRVRLLGGDALKSIKASIMATIWKPMRITYSAADFRCIQMNNLRITTLSDGASKGNGSVSFRS